MKKIFLVIASVLFLFLSAHVEQTLFAAAEKKPAYILYDFYAGWCGPCQEMMPHIKAFEEKHKDDVQVKKVDIDKAEYKKLTEKYGVNAIPRVILVSRKSKVLGDISGYKDEKELEAFYASALSFEIEITKKTDKELFEKAQKLIKEKKTEESYPYLIYLLNKNKKDISVVSTLAHLYFEIEDYSMAAQTYEKMETSTVFKQDAKLQYEYALSLIRSSWMEPDINKAKAILGSIEKVNRAYPWLHYALGMASRWTNNAEAEKEFLLALRDNPIDEKSAEELLGIYKNQQKWDEAIETKKLLNKMHIKQKTMDWNDFYDSQGLGWLYFQKGDFQKGMREYKKAATGDLTSVGYYYYGEVLELAREEEKAKEAYEKVLSGFSGNYTRNLSQKALNRIKRWEGKKKRVVFLGALVETLTKEKVLLYGLPEDTQGLFIQRLYANTQADYAGLKAGDVIQKINGRDVKTHEEYDLFLQQTKLDDTLTFDVLRDGEQKTFKLLYVAPQYVMLKLIYHDEKRLPAKISKHAEFYYKKTKAMIEKFPAVEKIFNEALEEASDFFKVPVKELEKMKFRLMVYDSIKSMGKREGDYTEGHVRTGVHDITVADKPLLKESMTRLLAFDMSMSLGHREPDFLFYGLGGYVAGTYNGKNIDALSRESFENGEIISVQDILVFNDFLCYERDITYPMASSFIKYLVENYEWDSFKELWKNANDYNFESEFKKSFGEPLEDAEKKWLEKIGVKSTTASADCADSKNPSCGQGF